MSGGELVKKFGGRQRSHPAIVIPGVTVWHPGGGHQTADRLVDTGAERSVVAEHIAKSLRLREIGYGVGVSYSGARSEHPIVLCGIEIPGFGRIPATPFSVAIRAAACAKAVNQDAVVIGLDCLNTLKPLLTAEFRELPMDDRPFDPLASPSRRRPGSANGSITCHATHTEPSPDGTPVAIGRRLRYRTRFSSVR